MGHAFTFTLQDMLIRLKRMDGFDTLWQPGTDHAGIATQVVVERQLAAEGKTKEDLGREAFVARVWKWKEESGGTIIRQLKQLGASCDWSRLRFTMDEGLSRAVREVFVRLYDEGLIYRDDYIVNWCPRCQTVLSDLEVEREERDAEFVYIKYGPLTLGTVRPETKLGDTGLAVHPDDPRYAQYVGRDLEIQSVRRPHHGAGGGGRGGRSRVRHRRHQGHAGPRSGRLRDRQAPRPAHPHRHRIRRQDDGGGRQVRRAGSLRDAQADRRGHAGAGAHRPHRAVPSRRRPLLSLQDRGGAARLQAVVRQRQAAGRGGAGGRARRAHHHRAVGVDEDLRPVDGEHPSVVHLAPAVVGPPDSRVVLRQADGSIHVSRTDLSACPQCGGSLRQDPDVLDTWFSSGLWPFSTLGWPDETLELRKYYPTSVLVTGFDIIFFWVARMAMLGLHFMKEEPFRDVYIHALVRDAEGQKMSKSKGNVVDPLAIMTKYGTDAFRFTLAALAAQGRDIRISDERVEGYRNFANKLWNASRLVLSNLDGYDPAGDTHAGRAAGPLDPEPAAGDDHQPFVRRSTATGSTTRPAALYQFLWNDFCDWYLEIAKTALYRAGEPAERQRRAAHAGDRAGDDAAAAPPVHAVHHRGASGSGCPTSGSRSWSLRTHGPTRRSPVRTRSGRWRC